MGRYSRLLDRPRSGILAATRALQTSLSESMPRISRHRHLLSLCTFAAVICVIYFPALIGNDSLITNGSFPRGPLFVGDPLAGGPITLPLELLASHAWAHLHLPIIDPYQGYGISLLANQGVPVYPPQLITHFLFPHNYSIWIVINLITIAFGSYLLASSFGQRLLGSLAVGAAAALAGVAPPNLNLGMLNPFALLPFVLLAIRFVLDPKSKYRLEGWLGAITSTALLCLSGFQEVLPLMAIVIVVYTLAMAVHFDTFHLKRRLLATTALSGVLGLAIGCVGLLPLLSVIRGGSDVNGPGAYQLHAPPYWLSTLSIPSLTNGAMGAQPQDLGQTVWTLGSPLFLVVVVLAIVLSLREGGKSIRWYVWPSAALVVFGIFGYSDVLHVLGIFDVPFLTSILMIRFLQFAWWIPWCLLLGVVISNVRHLKWFDIVGSFLVTSLFNLFFVAKFRDALVTHHLSSYLKNTDGATILALAIVCAFLLAAWMVRFLGPQGASATMTAIVIGSCIYFLPTNFFPGSDGTAVAALRVPGLSAENGNYLAFVGTTQQPTEYYSSQVWGPIIPHSYQQVVRHLFSKSETHGYGPLADALTFGFAAVNPRFVTVLLSLGVDTLVTRSALPAAVFGAVPPCRSSPQPVEVHDLCFLGRASDIGGPATQRAFAYAILDASPLVVQSAHPIAVPSADVAMHDLLTRISPHSSGLPASQYVTSNDRHLVPARHVVGISRTATTESVELLLHSETAGMAVLREAYSAGMHASVNGKIVPVMPVDGGLWAAVEVGRGTTRVELDYATTSDVIEFGIAFAGMLTLAIAWIGLALAGARPGQGRIRLITRRSPPPTRPRHARAWGLFTPTGNGRRLRSRVSALKQLAGSVGRFARRPSLPGLRRRRR